ncbi:SRPBCC domain-containing protein [Yoonia sp. GPGPB17]|uniref:SRPBCC family protein n=1 Tax=Yoonia sp. GPGPB17 TaxID=3026147 RepID=UPI0030BED75E
MTLQKSIYLKAAKSDVWAYLTDPDKLALWFHKPSKALAEGDNYEMFGTESGNKLMWGKVLTSTPHDHLSYTFTIGPMGDAVSTVTWTLDEVPGGTRLSLRHEGLPEGEAGFDLTLALDKGWDDHLARMRESLHAP